MYAAMPTRIREKLSRPAVIFAAGIAALVIHAFLGMTTIPPARAYAMDMETWSHFVSTTASYASSPFDQSIMSPVQGLGGQVPILGASFNPAIFLPRIFPYGDPLIWATIPVLVLNGIATFFLARSTGLPDYLSLLCTQAIVILLFPPMANMWSHDERGLSPQALGASFPWLCTGVAYGAIFLAIYASTGTLSFRMNLACTIVLPLLMLYAVLNEPMYCSYMFFLPDLFLLTGVLLGSSTRGVLLWRLAAGLACLVVALSIRLPGFYAAAAGYVARDHFPGEIYQEVQTWSMGGLLVRGGTSTACAVAVLMSCGLVLWLGTNQLRWFAAAVIVYQLFVLVYTAFYVYSGIRWTMVFPIMLEVGTVSTYAVLFVQGIWLGLGRLGQWIASLDPAVARFLASPAWRVPLRYWLVLALPALGLGYTLAARPAQRIPWDLQHADDRDRGGVVKDFLRKEVALGADGRFLGSVACILGVPGGNLMNRLGVPAETPLTKDIMLTADAYFRSFDPNLHMIGLWNQRIPTLEDNSHLVTPPFYYLTSRALSRPQDYHSRNWAVVTKAHPRLMAALGVRYLVTDTEQSDSMLALRAQQTNEDGVTIWVYELVEPNLANYFPTTTVVARDAKDAIAKMLAPGFSFHDTAIVHDDTLPELKAASTGFMCYERGGVRVRATASGPCLLVLPLQYSNSLRITHTVLNSKSVPIRLMRVNLLETGVLFDGEIHIKIAHVFGLFRGIDGRKRDIADCHRLGIEEDGTIPYPPNYQPLALQ